MLARKLGLPDTLNALLSLRETLSKGFRDEEGADVIAKSELRVLEGGAMKDMTTRSAKTQREIDVTASARGVIV